jgi:RHS repeat-associated protein
VGSYVNGISGLRLDFETGLAAAAYRDYSATSGRWLTPDPAGLAAVDPSNPQTWNRYAYVMNNPASNVDPLGLFAEPGPEGPDPWVGGDPFSPEPPTLPCNDSNPFCNHGPIVPPGARGGDGGGKHPTCGVVPLRLCDVNNGKLTPAQCQAAQTLLNREAQSGTTVAAWQSAIGFGDGTVQPFNSSDPGNAYANTALGAVKVDWFTDLRMTSLIPGPQVPAYIVGKLTWTGVRLRTGAPITNYLPFQDPVESRTMALAVEGVGFRGLFTPAFMKENCGK